MWSPIFRNGEVFHIGQLTLLRWSGRLTVVSSRSSDNEGRDRLLGALLRLSNQALLAELTVGLMRAGYSDLSITYTPALQALWSVPQGTRATELASVARITKQSMGALIDQLEQRGYVERIDDPADKRAKLVRLTTRGREAGRVVRALVRRIEGDWGALIGREKIATLKQTLAELLASLDATRPFTIPDS